MRLYNFIFFEPGGVVYYNFFVDAYSYYYETIWAIDDLTFGWFSTIAMSFTILHWGVVPLTTGFCVFILSLIYIIIFVDKYDLFELRQFTTAFFNFIFLLSFVFLLSRIEVKINSNVVLDFFNLNLLNLNLTFYADIITALFLLLTTFLFSIANLVSLYNIKYNYKLFCINLIILELLILLTFLSSNLFFFYLFFEASLIPMFLIIGMWGSRQRKLYAFY